MFHAEDIYPDVYGENGLTPASRKRIARGPGYLTGQERPDVELAALVRSRPLPALHHDAQPPQGWDSRIVVLAGAIRAWWDEGWDTPEHWAYVKYRDGVSAGLIERGFLVYRPHEAFKGTWNERAQAVNDAAINAADLMVNLSPEGVRTDGTDVEVGYAVGVGTRVLALPPDRYTVGAALTAVERFFDR